MAEIDLIGTNEIIERLNISTTQFTRIKLESPDIPKPISHDSGNTCVWERKSMLAWINKQPKKGLDNQMALEFLKKLYG